MFEVNEVVKSLVTAQGMEEGKTYIVVDVFQSSVGMFGTVVHYKLADGITEKVLPNLVSNGHMLLEHVGWA